MTPLGIVLLLAGVVAVVASFFVPDKEDREDKKDIAKKQEQIRRLMETELDGMKLRVNEATNETVETSMEKSERALEKITNDKIMAVSEYATTVMEEIDRNHKEVMFLYDMLNDKQTDVKNSLRHAEDAVKEVNEAAKNASETAIYATNVANAANEAVSAANEAVSAAAEAAENYQNMGAAYVATGMPAQVVYQNTQAPVVVNKEPEIPATAYPPTESVFSMAATMEDSLYNDKENEIEALTPVVKASEEPVKESIVEPERELNEFEMLERTTSFHNVNNNNQQILRMNAEGIPVVDIARQLSLGVGEVQLVIDLFK